MPLDQLAARMRDLPVGRQIVRTCQSGGRDVELDLAEMEKLFLPLA